MAQLRRVGSRKESLNLASFSRDCRRRPQGSQHRQSRMRKPSLCQSFPGEPPCESPTGISKRSRSRPDAASRSNPTTMQLLWLRPRATWTTIATPTFAAFLKGLSISVLVSPQNERRERVIPATFRPLSRRDPSCLSILQAKPRRSLIENRTTMPVATIATFTLGNHGGAYNWTA
jgi:hypothetical protein